jgi:hypothetical protein
MKLMAPVYGPFLRELLENAESCWKFKIAGSEHEMSVKIQNENQMSYDFQGVATDGKNFCLK